MNTKTEDEKRFVFVQSVNCITGTVADYSFAVVQ
jgi:hypothetical protein